MTHEEHQQRHVELHKAFDELLADWTIHDRNAHLTSTIEELMKWSYEQTQNPTDMGGNEAK